MQKILYFCLKDNAILIFYLCQTLYLLLFVPSFKEKGESKKEKLVQKVIDFEWVNKRLQLLFYNTKFGLKWFQNFRYKFIGKAGTLVKVLVVAIGKKQFQS